jgi:hypothetical protein
MTHLPIAPYVPESHTGQRYFSRGEGSNGVDLIGLHGRGQSARLTVIRFVDADVAKIELHIGVRGHTSTTTMACTAVDLRAIALRLLDAAHDIEANPAAKLMAAADMATKCDECGDSGQMRAPYSSGFVPCDSCDYAERKARDESPL